jgi:adenylate cyclase
MDPEGIERRLAAVLSADAVGYSRLMAEDEAATIRTVGAYREQIGVLVREHRGRVVDAPGDNLLAEFPTALDAVRAAAEVQRVLRARNAYLPAPRRMEFRIGVHLGDVARDGERIYGDGVNIAARLEGLAEPGGICISGTVHEQVEGKLDLRCEDLGEKSLKNIPRPIHAYRVRVEGEAPLPRAEPRPPRRVALAVGALALLIAGGLLLWNLDRRGSTAPEAAIEPARSGVPLDDEALTVPGFSGAPAIAVLAFDNLSGDPDQEYFADGIAEDLITRLSSWGSFPVIARNSSFSYKGQAVDVKRVSRELGVRYVVEGSVRKGGDRVRISAQLIDATTGHHVWAETYDRELREIFALQDEISLAVASSMLPELARVEIDRAVRKGPQNLDAYETGLRGRWHFWQFTPEHNAEARRLFERAAELDPRDADPRAGIALTHFADIGFEWSDSRSRSIAALERSAQDCIELDRESAQCQLSLGFAYRVTGRQSEEIAAFEHAVRLDPSLGIAHGWLGMALALAGRPEEAIASLEKALRLFPHSPAKGLFFESMAWAHFAAGRYGEAVAWARSTLEFDPRDPLAYRTLAASHAQLGRLEEARRALEGALRLEPDLSLRKVRQQNPTTDADFMARWLHGLRKAGLKEE